MTEAQSHGPLAGLLARYAPCSAPPNRDASETVTQASRSLRRCSCHSLGACPVSWIVAPTLQPSESRSQMNRSPPLLPRVALQRPSPGPVGVVGRRRTSSGRVVRSTQVTTVLAFHSSIAARMLRPPFSSNPGSIAYGMTPLGRRSSSSTGERPHRTGHAPVEGFVERCLRCSAASSSTEPKTMSHPWMARPSTTSWRTSRPR